MELIFYICSGVAIIATLLAIIGTNPMHSLLELITSLLAVGLIFFTLGAPFAGILEIIVYAGAIMVLFVFVVMMLNLGRATIEQERQWLKPSAWIAPALLTLVLLGELMQLLATQPDDHAVAGGAIVGAKAVGVMLYGPYLLAVELGSMLLLAGLVAAFHLGRSLD
ncbi:MAG: NADH-quinone oxidoreductase subunit J [Nevskiaceae bacterium]|nr:MAG: NADH-quinone oxidoreductase subunit J [Nevskiaceae bacterium]TBR73932.1 MAG: NADH-quinone oxidoreductase subunit J [Nevskiaceae bacterium]